MFWVLLVLLILSILISIGTFVGKKESIKARIGTSVAVLFFAFLLIFTGSDSKEELEEQAKLEACKQDPKCWKEKQEEVFYEKNKGKAQILCQPMVENHAQYSFEWTDGFLEPKFSYYRAVSLRNETMIIMGDTIKFQNGFGAWQNMKYECKYDAKNNKLLSAQVSPK